jgi:hypothetical protein
LDDPDQPGAHVCHLIHHRRCSNCLAAHPTAQAMHSPSVSLLVLMLCLVARLPSLSLSPAFPFPFPNLLVVRPSCRNSWAF